MKSDTSILKEIFKDIVFTKEETEIVSSVYHKIKVTKGTILIKPGDNVNDEYYILDGCLRSYRIDEHGKEHTIQFGIKDWWISDYTAFFSSSKATMSIEVIQDATLYQITSEDKNFLYSQIPKFERFFRIKLEKSICLFSEKNYG